MVADAVDGYGAVHGVTNYAGILRDSMVFDVDEDEWDVVVDVHLNGHSSVVRAVARHRRERSKAEGGFDRQRSVTCVSSGVAAGNPGQSNYSAAKAGILGLMLTTARERHRYDGRANALWSTALTRLTEDLSAMTGADEATMGPQLVPAAPVSLASEHAIDLNGVTLAIAGGDLAVVSNPERERTLSKHPETDGAWTAAEIDDRWDELTDGIDTVRVTP